MEPIKLLVNNHEMTGHSQTELYNSAQPKWQISAQSKWSSRTRLTISFISKHSNLSRTNQEGPLPSRVEWCWTDIQGRAESIVKTHTTIVIILIKLRIKHFKRNGKVKCSRVYSDYSKGQFCFLWSLSGMRSTAHVFCNRRFTDI